MPELYVSWSEYHRLIEELAAQIYQSGWEFNQIVCIAKGGLRVGDILCRLFDRPLAILAAASYRGEGNRQRGEIVFSEHLSLVGDLGDRLLLVDDLADSGISLRESVRWLQDHYGDHLHDCRTAVLWYKGCSVVQPDYFVTYLPDNPWIHQPFEYYERVSPAEVAARYTRLSSRP